jgi:hypothetical protein
MTDDEALIDIDVEANQDAFGDDAEPGELARPGRRALVTLLTNRFISKSANPEAWNGLISYQEEITARLAEMFLELIVDTDFNIAFKRQSGEEDVPVLLRKEKPLSRDASFVLIFLRREHAFTDAHDEAVTITRTQISEFLSQFYVGISQDEVRWYKQVSAAIAAIDRIGLLSAEADFPDLFTIAPAIVPLITTTELAHFERAYLTHTDASDHELPEDTQ